MKHMPIISAIADGIGRHFLETFKGDRIKTRHVLDVIRIHALTLVDGQLNVTCERPGNLIGVRGTQIANLLAFLKVDEKTREFGIEHIHITEDMNLWNLYRFDADIDIVEPEDADDAMEDVLDVFGVSDTDNRSDPIEEFEGVVEVWFDNQKTLSDGEKLRLVRVVRERMQVMSTDYAVSGLLTVKNFIEGIYPLNVDNMTYRALVHEGIKVKFSQHETTQESCNG